MPTGRLSIAASRQNTVRLDGRELVVFAGCDYLGLAHDPRVTAALERGVAEFGVSSSGSRETTGNTTAHDELEHDLARFLRLEAALLVPDGYLSNLIFAQGLPPSIERVLVDRESHVSVRDALRVAGRVEVEYAFVDASAARAAARGITDAPFAIFTDGVFPVLRGDAPLPDLLAMLPPDGVLVVDDCHGIGVRGATGRGSVEHHALRDPRVVVTGTLSKALGSFGGFVAGARSRIERTRRESRAYVGSTPIPPALARAASAALTIATEEGERRARLFRHVDAVAVAFRDAGRPTNSTPFPVFAFQLETPAAMERAHQALVDRGLLVPHVRYPDALGGYFRLALRATHTDEQVDRLLAALRRVFAP